MGAVKRIVARCNYVLAAVAAVILFALLVAVFGATLSRYLLHEPLAFLIDLSGYGLIFVAFLAAPWLMSIGGHVEVDFLVSRVSPRAERYWRAVIDFVTAVVALAIMYPSVQLTTDFFSKGRVMQDSIKTPQWILILPIAVGCLFVAIQAVLNGIARIRAPESSPTGAASADPAAERKAGS